MVLYAAFAKNECVAALQFCRKAKAASLHVTSASNLPKKPRNANGNFIHCVYLTL